MSDDFPDVLVMLTRIVLMRLLVVGKIECVGEMYLVLCVLITLT